MGYKRAKKKYRLKFEDPELAGFEVTLGSLNIGEFMDLTSSLGQVQAAEGSANVNRLLEKFAGSIVSWNLEDEDGTPVPATFDGVKAQELGFIMQIITAWMDAMAAVDPKLLPNANGHGTLPEVSLPMERLSPSLVN